MIGWTGVMTTVAGTVKSSSAMMVLLLILRSNVRLCVSLGRLAGGDGGGVSSCVVGSVFVVADTEERVGVGVSSTLIRVD